MATINADELISDIAARMCRRSENAVLGLLYDGRPTSEGPKLTAVKNAVANEPRADITLDVDELRRTRYTELPIYTDPRLPAYKARITLSRKLDVSEEFRANMNGWLREFFGEEPCVITVCIPGLGRFSRQEAIFCNPRIEAEIRRRRASGEAFV